MAIDTSPAFDMAMMESPVNDLPDVDYDAENDYAFQEPIYRKNFNFFSQNINYQDKNGTTLLMLLVQQDSHHNILKFVLDTLAANSNLQDHQGKTALHFAVANGNISIVNVLLSHGSNIDAQDHEGKTPLYYSVENNHVPITDLLIDKGANKKLGTFENGTLPKDICRTQAMKKLFKKPSRVM